MGGEELCPGAAVPGRWLPLSAGAEGTGNPSRRSRQPLCPEETSGVASGRVELGCAELPLRAAPQPLGSAEGKILQGCLGGLLSPGIILCFSSNFISSPILIKNRSDGGVSPLTPKPLRESPLLSELKALR